MLAELLLIAVAGVIDPMDMSGHQMYPSGVKEVDKYPLYPYPQSKLAKLSIGQDILSANGKIIKSGHYLIGLSISKKEILIFEGTKELYTLKVSSLKTMDKPLKFATSKFYTDNNGECFIVLKQDNYVALAKVVLVKTFE